MSRISGFLQNELDRVNGYLKMAHANLITITELCEDNCHAIADKLDVDDEKVLDYLNNFELIKIHNRLEDAEEIIEKFKKFSLELENARICVD